MYIWTIYKNRFSYKIIHFNYPVLQSGVCVLKVKKQRNKQTNKKTPTISEGLNNFRLQFWSQNNVEIQF